MQNIIFGIIAFGAGVGISMSGIGLVIGVPLLLLAVYMIIKGILQVFWGVTKLSAKGAMAGYKATKSKLE
jgi:hypothetical protein